MKKKIVSDDHILEISQPGDNTDTSGGFERLRIRNDNDPQEVRKRL